MKNRIKRKNLGLEARLKLGASKAKHEAFESADGRAELTDNMQNAHDSTFVQLDCRTTRGSAQLAEVGRRLDFVAH